MTKPDLDAAHLHCKRHRAELERSSTCGCFYCGAIFVPAAIVEWVDCNGPQAQWSALCPDCGIDSVLGDASGLPIEPSFLQAMHERWFEGAVPASEVRKMFEEKQ